MILFIDKSKYYIKFDEFYEVIDKLDDFRTFLRSYV
jgi:hypothetical protein